MAGSAIIARIRSTGPNDNTPASRCCAAYACPDALPMSRYAWRRIES